MVKKCFFSDTYFSLACFTGSHTFLWKASSEKLLRLFRIQESLYFLSFLLNFNFDLLFYKCVKFRGPSVIMAIVPSWIAYFSRRYIVGLKNFLVGISWAPNFPHRHFVGLNFFLLGIS